MIETEMLDGAYLHDGGICVSSRLGRVKSFQKGAATGRKGKRAARFKMKMSRTVANWSRRFRRLVASKGIAHSVRRAVLERCRHWDAG